MGQTQAFPEVDYGQVNHSVSSTGKRLYTRSWSPEGKARGVCYFCHGVAEHIERYHDMAKVFTDLGIAVYGHDHVGHGRSEGERVHIDDYSEYIDDMVLRINSVHEDHPGVPVILFGHSMGGLVAFLTAALNPDIIDFVILSGPAIQADPDVATPFKVTLATWVSAMMPQLNVGSLPKEYTSRDPAVREMNLNDPYMYQGGMKAGWAVATLRAQDEAKELFADFGLPLLVVHGDADKLCRVEGSQELIAGIGSADKLLKEYEGGYHEVEREPDGIGEAVYRDISEWTKERLEKFVCKAA